MIGLSPAHLATWLICGIAVAGVIIRPGRLPEALWAVLGAAALLLGSLISVTEAVHAVRKGLDVYLFLTGMMLLAELARHEGLFDWVAAQAVRHSRGSAARLFGLVYGVGTLVTIFLSNDATAVVLTPAVYAAAQRARANPLPHLFVCAFIANAASFVLPIANPANLVVYGSQLPSLGRWLREFGTASLASIAVSFCVLRFLLRRELSAVIARDAAVPPLARGGRIAGAGIGVTALVLCAASARDWPLGLPTCLAGLATTLAVLALNRVTPWAMVQEISWSVLALVAGLFVLVEAVAATGVLQAPMAVLPARAAADPHGTALAAGVVVALLCNLVNNLPLGLLAGAVAGGAHLAPPLTGALLIGVDLGPNLSVTGSLATILWLVALRREGQAMSAWRFLKLGSVMMPLALLASLAAFTFR